MRGRLSIVLLVNALAALAFATLVFAIAFPPLTGRVVDGANILDATTEEALTTKLAELEAKTNNQMVVVTLRSLEGLSIEDYGYQLGRHWGIGQKAKNNGALLIVAPNERKVRIEVGYGLEGTLTDAVTHLIIQNAILPRFRVNDVPGGIARGVDDLIQALSGDAEEFKRQAAQRPESRNPGLDMGTIILLIVVFFILMRLMRGAGGGSSLRQRRLGYPGPIFIPSGGGWSSGSGGGGFGGGFSGGGGSFGGGGSSGSW